MEVIRVPIDKKIVDFLYAQSEPVTIQQIDDGIDCYQNIIASYLKDLAEKGVVIVISHGKKKLYRLAR